MCPKLTSLNELTEAPDAENDFIYIVDSSESSANLKGKKIKPTNLLTDIGITKTGSPSANQVGLWTGANNMKGDASLTFDTTIDQLVIGTDSGGQVTTFNYPTHVTIDSTGHGLQIGPEDEGDVSDHPSMIQTSQVVTTDIGNPRTAHLERTYNAGQPQSILGVVHTLKFGGTTTITQGQNTINYSSQIESDNPNLTIDNYFHFKGNNPRGVGGGAFSGTATNVYGYYIEELTAGGGTNYGFYSENGNLHKLGGKTQLIGDTVDTNVPLEVFGFSDSSSAVIKLQRARGNEATPTTVVNGDAITGFQFRGYDGDSYEQVGTITVDVDGTVSDGVVPGQFRFRLSNSAGTLTDRLTIDSGGYIGLNGNPTTNISITDNSSKDGSATSRTFRAEPTVTLQSGILLNGFDFIPTATIQTGADHVSGYQFRPILTPSGTATLDRLDGFKLSNITIPTNLTVNEIRGLILTDPTVNGTLTNYDGIWTSGLKSATGRNNIIYSEGGDVDLIAKDASFSNTLTMERYHTSAGVGSNIFLNRSKGTLATPLTLASGDRISNIAGYGYDGTDFGLSSGIEFKTSELFTVSAHGGEIVFKTVSNGTTSIVNRMTIGNDGDVELLTQDKGLIFKSPNGSRYRLTVDNSGVLGTTAL